MTERENQQYPIDVLVGFTERTVKKLWVIIILLVVLLFGSNAAWIYYESQFETVQTEITQDNQDGINNFIGNDGDIVNGSSDDQDQDANP